MERLDDQFDLLTATLIGVAIGVGTTLLLRSGPRGERPVTPMLRAAGRGAKRAGAASVEGARWAAERGADLWDRVPVDAAADRVRDYMDEARESINDVVEAELRDLRKAIRRQRKRLGV